MIDITKYLKPRGRKTVSRILTRKILNKHGNAINCTVEDVKVIKKGHFELLEFKLHPENSGLNVEYLIFRPRYIPQLEHPLKIYGGDAEQWKGKKVTAVYDTALKLIKLMVTQPTTVTKK
jgi:hypothetical protein